MQYVRSPAGLFFGIALFVLMGATFANAESGIPAGVRRATDADLAAMRAAGIPNPVVGMLWDPSNPYVGIDVGDAKTYLLRKNDAGGQDIAGLNAEFACRLARFMKASEATGYNFRISSGFRSRERQAALHASKPRLAAPPGGSNHERGLAADLLFNGKSGGCPTYQPCLWAHQNAARFGLGFPMAGPNGIDDRSKAGRKYEPWHIEPFNRDVSGANKCGDLSTGPAIDPGAAPLGLGNAARGAMGGQPSAPQAAPAAAPQQAAQQQQTQPPPPPLGVMNSTPYPPGTCAPQFYCATNNLYYRASTCVDQFYQACQGGCSGNSCIGREPVSDLLSSALTTSTRKATDEKTGTTSRSAFELIGALAEPEKEKVGSTTPFELIVGASEAERLQDEASPYVPLPFGSDASVRPFQQTFTSADLRESAYAEVRVERTGREAILANMREAVSIMLDYLRPFSSRNVRIGELPGE